METWPTSTVIPYPSPDYGFGNASSSIRTQMESGRVRQRRRFTSDQRIVSVVWDLRDYEFEVFQSFVFNSLNAGNDWFYITLPGSGGFKTHTARFVEGKYDAKNKGLLFWLVSAQLELRSIPIMDAATLAFVLDPGAQIDELEAAAISLHELIHETLPVNFN